MKEHQISVWLKGRSEFDDDFADFIHSVFDDGGLESTAEGDVFLVVDREANTLSDALVSVAKQVLVHLPALGPVELVADELVTAPQIAERIGLTRQAVFHHARGTRGDGTFPEPLAGEQFPLYSWSQVQAWYATKGQCEPPELSERDRKVVELIQDVLNLAVKFAEPGFDYAEQQEKFLDLVDQAGLRAA